MPEVEITSTECELFWSNGDLTGAKVTVGVDTGRGSSPAVAYSFNIQGDSEYPQVAKLAYLERGDYSSEDKIPVEFVEIADFVEEIVEDRLPEEVEVLSPDMVPKDLTRPAP